MARGGLQKTPEDRLAELALRGPTFRAMCSAIFVSGEHIAKEKNAMARYPLSVDLPRYPYLPDNLLRIRRDRRLSQQILAERASTSQRRISELENGQRPRSKNEVAALAVALGVDVSALITRHVVVPVPESQEFPPVRELVSR